ncbi:MAG: hypothetical protein L7F78_27840 [Syntrophales bacterium LBB04]|nr:hypothetical protein [Syntrophales bacterium LBB04]
MREADLSDTVRTECAHCRQPMELQIGSDLRVTTKDGACEPIVFVPHVDLFEIKDESIIDAF